MATHSASSGLHTVPAHRHLGSGSSNKENYAPIILLLKGYLDLYSPDALEQAVQNALASELAPELRTFGIDSAASYLAYANDLLHWIPHETQNGKDIYDTICAFYFVLDQEPLKSVQNPIAPAEVDKPLSWLSAWIVAYAQLVGLFMDTPDSFTTESYASFEASPLYRMSEALVPEGGYKTFNEFFARRLKPGSRPLTRPHDPSVITYAADSTFDGAWRISGSSHIDVLDPSLGGAASANPVTVKRIEWDIRDLLRDSQFAGEFGDGIFLHCFLNTYNYHRQHAPIAGVIREARVIQGAAYLDVEVGHTSDTANDDGSGKKKLTLKPVRRIQPTKAGADPDAQDNTGYQFLQSRGLIVIESRELGLVAVLPIGMAQVSSIKLSVKPGDRVEKGQEISYFHFGGSDCVMVFQKKAGLDLGDFPDAPLDHWSPVGSRLNTKTPDGPPPLK